MQQFCELPCGGSKVVMPGYEVLHDVGGNISDFFGGKSIGSAPSDGVERECESRAGDGMLAVALARLIGDEPVANGGECEGDGHAIIPIWNCVERRLNYSSGNE